VSVRITAEIVDDLDDSVEDVTTVQFALDGVNYEVVDLTRAGALELRRLLGHYTQAGRSVDAQPRTRKRPRTTTAAAVREWALREGYPILATGGIPRTVRAAYEAHEQSPPNLRAARTSPGSTRG
jgi:hypothetical protein